MLNLSLRGIYVTGNILKQIACCCTEFVLKKLIEKFLFLVLKEVDYLEYLGHKLNIFS